MVRLLFELYVVLVSEPEPFRSRTTLNRNLSQAEDVQFADVGFGLYVDEQPNKRFNVYTRGNAGEVWPNVAYPLSLSMARAGIDPAAEAFGLIGMASEEELQAGGTLLVGCFAGYMYLNLSFNRIIAVRTPGTTIESSDATYLGSETEAPAYVAQKGDKNLRASFNAAKFGVKMLRATELPWLADDERQVEQLRASMPNLATATDEELLDAVFNTHDPVMHMFARHLVVSGQAGGAVQMLSQICEDQLNDRSLALTLLGGLGDVASAAPSFALWDLGRTVAASPALMALFDEGVGGLGDRLANHADASAFNAQFADFLAEFGSRGPNEWETAADVWETKPELALALVDRMRVSLPENDPQAIHQKLVSERERATADARSRLKGPAKWLFNKALAAASLYSPARERSKTTVIAGIHLGRLASRELGRRYAERTPGGQIDDVYFVVLSELHDYLSDPASFTETIADRRRVRDELSKRQPPFVFEGEMPPPNTWPLRSELAAHAEPQLQPGETLTGLAGCAGVAEGIARVITDITDPGDLGPGDVLIAPLTDPAWTPLFVPAEAVVVNVGGQMSHAVIVSRELGKPCVVAATDATLRIPDGARVRVDGTNGTVTLL